MALLGPMPGFCWKFFLFFKDVTFRYCSALEFGLFFLSLQLFLLSFTSEKKYNFIFWHFPWTYLFQLFSFTKEMGTNYMFCDRLLSIRYNF